MKSFFSLTTAVLLFAFSSTTKAELVDFAGVEFTATLEITNPAPYQDEDSATVSSGSTGMVEFEYGPLSVQLTIADDDSDYVTFGGTQATLYLGNSNLSAFTIEAGSFTLTITGLFASSESDVLISDFELANEYPGIFTSYDAITGTLVITANDDIVLSADSGTIYEGNFTTSAIPEPGSAALGLGAIAGLFAACRRRRIA